MAKVAAEGLGSVHADEWPEGLQFGVKSLSTKKVARARVPSEVLQVCARHNLRRNNLEHRHRCRIDPARRSFNSVLVGADCPEAVAAEALAVLARLGLELPGRVDAVVAFEVVIQPPAGADTVEFWCAALAWVRRRFEHVVSAVVHRDQKRPHAHVLVLPVMAGRLAGRELQRGDYGAPKLRRDFLAHMRASLGLRNDRPRPDALTALALTVGKGAKTHAEAARRDAKLERRARVGMDVRGHGRSGAMRSMSKPAMSSIAQRRVSDWWSLHGDEFGWLMGL